MGFRDFRDFNIAMLGKQGWRFVSNPNSLVSRLYKARYFPKGTFLEAEAGNNPSFVWRSILEAKDLIKSGMRWKVGSGDFINILGQPWLLDDHNPFITSNSRSLDNTKVASIMTTYQSGWDEDILADLLNERDQSCFCRLKKIVGDSRTIQASGQCWQRVLPEVNCAVSEDLTQWWEKVLIYCNNERRVEIASYLVQWRLAHRGYTGISYPNLVQGDGAVFWAKPQMDIIKITVDGATFTEFHASGIGMIARDDKGELILACTIQLGGLFSAELVVIESDSLVVVQAIRSKVLKVSPFGRVIEECRRSLMPPRRDHFHIDPAQLIEMIGQEVAQAVQQALANQENQNGEGNKNGQGNQNGEGNQKGQHHDESITDYMARFIRLAGFAGTVAGTTAQQADKFK
ncbi:uncharacterized protein LOC141703747 [Apium graveolens]|uniref:uncharacterized protein LOC141692533 n=1 Tax=Apium graveolens TaxID=4045 RepID=UPI003D7A45A4